MTRDRPEKLSNLLFSISNIPFNITISDNSTQNYSYKEFGENISYIRRSGNLSGIEHFNKILTEVNCKYFAILHDDDIILENIYIKFIFAVISSNCSAAYCANAFKYDSRKRLLSKILRNSSSFLTYDDIIKYYFHPLSAGNPPFPVYIYNKNLLGELKLNPAYGGKFCDASFILSISKLSSIKYIDLSPMISIIDGTNDQCFFGPKDYKTLYNFALKNNKNLLSVLNLYRISRFFSVMKFNNYKLRNLILVIKIYFNLLIYYSLRLGDRFLNFFYH